jgi:hypothetical protein
MELRRKERRNKFKIKIMFSSNILRHWIFTLYNTDNGTQINSIVMRISGKLAWASCLYKPPDAFLYSLISYHRENFWGGNDTDCTEHSLSWESNISSADVETFRLLWNTKFYYRVHKNLPVVAILCGMNTVHIPTRFLYYTF